MSDCSSCISKCRGVKISDCPFYEEDKFRGVREALDNLQESFWGNYRYGSSADREQPRPYGESLVRPITLEDVTEATGLVPDTIWNTLVVPTTTNIFSTGTINNSTWTTTQEFSLPEGSAADPSEAPRSSPE